MSDVSLGDVVNQPVLAQDEHPKPSSVSLFWVQWLDVVLPAGADTELCSGTVCGSGDTSFLSCCLFHSVEGTLGGS